MTPDKKNHLPKLLAGFQDFPQFIEDHAVFVDKTEIISELISQKGGTYFLSRPRRFGKTLLLDTIKNIFEGNQDLFNNLDIVKKQLLMNWEPFPVIWLSFNAYPTDPVAVKDRLISELNKIVKTHSLPMADVTDVADISSIIWQMSLQKTAESIDQDQKQNSRYPKNVVFLVDEYDYPLLNNLGNDEAIVKIRLLLHDFYSAVKSSFQYLRFTLITGITKFEEISLFSGLNNINDITINKKYSTICGFTKKEILKYYDAHIDKTLECLITNQIFRADANTQTLINKLMEWYDGYSWDGIHKVINPYSIAKFFEQQTFDYYWYKSGGPILSSLIKLKDETYFKIFSKNFRLGDTLPISNINTITEEAILFHSGYLTIDSEDKSSTTPAYILKTPNMEIAYAIIQEFIHQRGILSKPLETINSKYSSFVDSFDFHKEKTSAFLLSSCLSEIPSHFQNSVELIPHVMMFTLLNIKGQRAKMEVNVAQGRIDLVYTSPNQNVTVIEIKHHKSNRQISPEKIQKILEHGISKAFFQAENKKYALSFFSNSKKIFVAAVSVYNSTDVMIRFKQKIFRVAE
jgi:hypothetical protein